MTDKTRILILSTAYLPHIGGSELAIKNITDRIDDIEFDLVTARLNKNDLEYEKIGHVSVFRVGGFLSLFSFLLPKTFLPLAIFFRARKLIRLNNYKLIHAYQISEAAGAGWLLKLFYPKLKLLVTMQEGKELDKQGFLINFFRKVILKKADRATAISRYLKNYIFKINTSLPVDVIPNGVDGEHFSRDFSYGELTGLENKLGIMPDDRVIITVSRLVPKNGVDLLIEAMGVLTTNYPLRQSYSPASTRLGEAGGASKLQTTNYKLLIVGDGPMRKNLELRITNYELQDKVIFAGTVSQENLPLYLKISDVFVRPSRSEGLGSAFLEAMAASVPIVGTKVGGIPDFLEDRRTGLFCSGEPADIAFKINILLENDKLREGIVENAKGVIEERYSWDKIAEEFRRLYLEIQ